MKGAFPVIIIGIAIITLGTIFHFQGQGVVGPESSFMYKNPDWISNGQTIAIVGMLVIGFGIFMKIKN